MKDMDFVREHMEIVGSDGGHIGALLKVRDGQLVLASGDFTTPKAPRLPLELVDAIDTVIRLNAPARDVIAHWLPSTTPAENPPPS